MLKDNIFLKSATGSFQYVLTAQTGSESKRTRIDSQPGIPHNLVLKHSAQGKGVDAVDRHLVQISQSVKDGQGIVRTLIINTTISVPREGFTTAQVQALLDQQLSLFRSPVAGLDVEANVVAGGSNATSVNAILLGES